MKSIDDIVLIMYARLNSERVPNKMTRVFAQTTLIDIAIKKTLALKTIPKENIYLFVHEQELIDIGKKHGINILERSELSANTEDCLKGVHEWYNKLNYKFVVTFNACVPLLKTETIDNFIRHYIKSEHNGLFGVVKKRNYFWDNHGNLLTNPPEGKKGLGTQIAPLVYEAAHCLYASQVDWIEKDIWLGTFKKPNDPELYVVDESETLDIDYPWQFDLAEASYLKQYKDVPVVNQK